jgi:hypothetical protein
VRRLARERQIKANCLPLTGKYMPLTLAKTSEYRFSRRLERILPAPIPVEIGENFRISF